MHHCYIGLQQHRIPLCHNVTIGCFFGAICGTGPITTLTRQSKGRANSHRLVVQLSWRAPLTFIVRSHHMHLLKGTIFLLLRPSAFIRDATAHAIATEMRENEQLRAKFPNGPIPEKIRLDLEATVRNQTASIRGALARGLGITVITIVAGYGAGVGLMAVFGLPSRSCLPHAGYWSRRYLGCNAGGSRPSDNDVGSAQSPRENQFIPLPRTLCLGNISFRRVGNLG